MSLIMALNRAPSCVDPSGSTASVSGHAAEGPLRTHMLGMLLGLRSPKGSLLELSRHEKLYTSGSMESHIYVVEHGQIKTEVVAASGKRCLLGIYAVGDIFGEIALLGLPRADTAVALTRSVVRRLPLTEFQMALTVNDLQQVFLGYLSLRLLEQQKVIASMVTMSCELRLAVRLLDLAAQHGKARDHAVRIEIRFTQEDFAEMVGTTRTRIGQFLKRFRQLGLLELTPRSHMVVHQAELAAWIEDAAGDDG